MKKSDFYYDLPESLIAQHPLPERNASRLLCLTAPDWKMRDRMFADFPDLLDARDLLVFNDTRVIPARLYGQKATGGRVEILIERIRDERRAIAHVRASKAPKPESVIELEHGFQCRVLGRAGDLFEIEFDAAVPLPEILETIGHVPLPPYIERADEKADLSRYQTVFAKAPGAVAAPTAGLHFDRETLDRIAAKGVASAYVTLHVGSGTFQPVRAENLADHVMHQEFYSVPEETVAAVHAARARGGRVVAIGTTAIRALESASRSGSLKAGCGDTDLFITPGYAFRSVDALLTNFHLPESTLLMLVSAFAGYERIMYAYRHAIERNYRFFSYGDAMFLDRV